ncbi:MAG: hypothetical protein QM775_35325 [Pirellulales bacterium]
MSLRQTLFALLLSGFATSTVVAADDPPRKENGPKPEGPRVEQPRREPPQREPAGPPRDEQGPLGPRRPQEGVGLRPNNPGEAGRGEGFRLDQGPPREEGRGPNNFGGPEGGPRPQVGPGGNNPGPNNPGPNNAGPNNPGPHNVGPHNPGQHGPGMRPGMMNAHDLDRLKEADPEMYPFAKDDSESEQKSFELSEQYRRAKNSEERERIKKELAGVVENHFDVRQSRRELELSRLQEQIGRMRESLDKRLKDREVLIQQRIAELTGERDGSF